jgi:hypothetical protein
MAHPQREHDGVDGAMRISRTTSSSAWLGSRDCDGAVKL